MEREELLQLYKKEKDPNVKDRLMLNIRVRFENHSITEAAHSLGKVTSWGSKWYRRFAKAGLEGLQNLPRPGRPARITGEETAGIRKEMDGRQYWTVGGARELISKVTGVTCSVSSVYKMLRRWGYFLRAPVKRHVRRPPDEEIARFQKGLAELIPKKIEEGYTVAVQDETIVTADARPRRVYARKGRCSVSSVYKMLRRWGYFLRAPVKRHVRRPPDEEIARFQKGLAELIPKKIEEGYTVAVQDETIVTADARPRRVYARKGRRAVCTVTGSHGKTVVYGLQTMDGRGMCVQYDRFTTENFADFLKRAHRRFPRMAMILDRAPQHTARISRQTAEDLGGLELEYLPPGCPDLNAMEEKWRQMKHRTLDVPYVALGNLRKEITRYLRYHMPVLQIENYLYRKL